MYRYQELFPRVDNLAFGTTVTIYPLFTFLHALLCQVLFSSQSVRYVPLGAWFLFFSFFFLIFLFFFFFSIFLFFLLLFFLFFFSHLRKQMQQDKNEQGKIQINTTRKQKKGKKESPKPKRPMFSPRCRQQT